MDWPERGRASQQQIRGMSDYERGAGSIYSANYITADGAMLYLRNGKWKAQYKNYTTKWKSSVEDAIEAIDNNTK